LAKGWEGCPEQPADVPEAQALVTEINRVLQLQRVERPTPGGKHRDDLPDKEYHFKGKG
jgi:hypothetical protein